MLVPQVAVLLEQPADNSIEVGGQLGIQMQRRRRGAIQDGVMDHGRRVTAEGRPARRHFVKYSAETEQVCASID